MSHPHVDSLHSRHGASLTVTGWVAMCYEQPHVTISLAHDSNGDSSGYCMSRPASACSAGAGHLFDMGNVACSFRGSAVTSETDTYLDKISEYRGLVFARTEKALDCMRTQQEFEAITLLREASQFAALAGVLRGEMNDRYDHRSVSIKM